LACTNKVQPVKSTAVQRDRQKPTITLRKSAAVEPVKSLVAQSSLSQPNALKLVDSNTEPRREEVNTNAQAEKDKFELRGWIKRPEGVKTAYPKINRGFIVVEVVDKLQEAYLAFNLRFNPDEPDVFFHLNDCCDFQPRYDQYVKFSVKVADTGRRLQAKHVKLLSENVKSKNPTGKDDQWTGDDQGTGDDEWTGDQACPHSDWNSDTRYATSGNKRNRRCRDFMDED